MYYVTSSSILTLDFLSLDRGIQFLLEHVTWVRGDHLHYRQQCSRAFQTGYLKNWRTALPWGSIHIPCSIKASMDRYSIYIGYRANYEIIYILFCLTYDLLLILLILFSTCTLKAMGEKNTLAFLNLFFQLIDWNTLRNSAFTQLLKHSTLSIVWLPSWHLSHDMRLRRCARVWQTER